MFVFKCKMFLQFTFENHFNKTFLSVWYNIQFFKHKPLKLVPPSSSSAH